MRTLLAALLILLPAIAQGPRQAMGWWDSPIARDLNLTDDQTRRIRETVREYRTRLIDQRAAMEKAEGELEDLFNEGNVDQKRAGEAIDRLANARGELTRTMSQMSLRLRSVLTQEQWHELQRRSPMRARMRGEGALAAPKRGGRTDREAAPPPPPNK